MAGLTDHVGLCEIDASRRATLARHFPSVPIERDVHQYAPPEADIVFGGPPCQETSVAAAVHGKRSGASLWPEMHRIGIDARAEWIVVEQPPGHKTWEAQVCADLSRSGYHVAKLEFGAHDIGAPYPRRRVYLLACTSLPRLEVAWKAGPSAIDSVKRSANARGAWDTRKLCTLRVDAKSAGEMDSARSAERKARIEALGDSNPPEMAEVIGRCILEAT